MRALAYHGRGDVRIDTVPDPVLQADDDVILRVTSTAICGSDLHTWRGDLVVSLIAPDGSAYVLHNRAGGSADNIDQTFTVNLSSEPRNGTWRLRVQDAAAADVDFINSWTLTVG